MMSDLLTPEYIYKIRTHLDGYISGKQFNELFPDIEFVKLTNENENHNGYQYHDDMNIDIIEFDITYYCCKGGMYFTLKSGAHRWVIYKPDNVMRYIRKVLIPNDAKVFIEDYYSFKTDKFILDKKEPITTDTYVNYVKLNMKQNIISFLENKFLYNLFAVVKNNEFYLECAKYDYRVLQYIPINMLSDEICSEALKQHGIAAAQYIPVDTYAKIKA